MIRKNIIQTVPSKFEVDKRTQPLFLNTFLEKKIVIQYLLKDIIQYIRNH